MITNPEPDQETVDAFVGAAHGDLAAVQKLLAQYPAILDRSASWGEFAIQAAAQTGQKEIAELLLAAGAPLDICTASMLGMADRVKAFLQGDPSLAHATGAHRLPVMYHAAVRGEIPVAEILVSHGADVNANAGRNTALHAAVQFNQPAMVEWLLAHGAAVDDRDYQGKTPVALAVEGKHAAIAELLKQAGANA